VLPRLLQTPLAMPVPRKSGKIPTTIKKTVVQDHKEVNRPLEAKLEDSHIGLDCVRHCCCTSF
jgi:hypothetical protein